MRRIVHNLRNPLAGIRNMAELTQRQCSADELVVSNATAAGLNFVQKHQQEVLLLCQRVLEANLAHPNI